jgi:hypothetical protein
MRENGSAMPQYKPITSGSHSITSSGASLPKHRPWEAAHLIGRALTWRGGFPLICQKGIVQLCK